MVGDNKPEVKEVKAEVPKIETPKVDATTLTFVVWILFRLNYLQRQQLRDFLDIIKKGDWPQDPVKYMQDEVSKMSS